MHKGWQFPCIHIPQTLLGLHLHTQQTKTLSGLADKSSLRGNHCIYTTIGQEYLCSIYAARETEAYDKEWEFAVCEANGFWGIRRQTKQTTHTTCCNIWRWVVWTATVEGQVRPLERKSGNRRQRNPAADQFNQANHPPVGIQHTAWGTQTIVVSWEKIWCNAVGCWFWQRHCRGKGGGERLG